MKGKNKRKAFTIVELLGVVVVLAILALVVIPSVVQYMNKGKDEYNKSLKEQLVIAGKNYYSDNKSKIPVRNETSDFVILGTLQSNNLISKNFKDADGFPCDDSYVTVIKDETGKITYHGCLVCKNGDNGVSYKDFDNEYCDVKNSTDTGLYCSLKYDQDTKKVFFTDKSEDASYYYITNEESIEREQIMNQRIDSVNDVIIGTPYYGYVMNEDGEIESCSIVPKKIKDKLLECHFTKQPTEGQVIQSTFNFKLSCSGDAIETSDYNPSLIVPNAGTTMGKVNNVIDEGIDENGNRLFTVSYVPNLGAVGKDQLIVKKGFLYDSEDKVNDQTAAIKSNEFAIDAQVPSTTFTATAAAKSGSWYKAPVTVKAKCTSINGALDSLSVNGTNGTISGSTGSWSAVESSGSSVKKYTATCIGKNGKKGVDDDSFGIDSTDPTISFSLNKSATSGGWYKAPLTITVTCSDTGSGVASLSAGGKTGTASVSVTRSSAGNPYSITATCKDKVGHTAEVTKKYNIKVSSANCDKCGCSAYKSCTSQSCCGCKTWNYTTNYKYAWGSSSSHSNTSGCPSSGTSGCTKSSQVGKSKISNCKSKCTKCKKAGGTVNSSPPCKSPRNNTCTAHKYTWSKKTCTRSSYKTATTCRTVQTCTKSCCGCKTCDTCWHY